MKTLIALLSLCCLLTIGCAGGDEKKPAGDKKPAETKPEGDSTDGSAAKE